MKIKSVGGYAVQCNLYDSIVAWKVRPAEGKPGLSRSYPNEFEGLIGHPREHIEFAIWFLAQKKLVERTDDSRLAITGAGVEYLEQNYRENLKRRRLASENPK